MKMGYGDPRAERCLGQHPADRQDHIWAQLRHAAWLRTTQIPSSLMDERTIVATTTWGPR